MAHGSARVSEWPAFPLALFPVTGLYPFVLP